MSQIQRSQQGAQDAGDGQGDRIKQRSRSGNLQGPQQEMAPPGRDLHKPSPQSTKLNSNEQQTLHGFPQATEGQQGARQEQRVASDGSQSVSSNPHIVEPTSRPFKLGDRQGGKTLLAHGTIEKPPIWVNSKQYDCILRYRAAKEKMGWNTKTPRPPNRSESRRKHAQQRLRGSGGRFSKKPVEGEVGTKDDDNGHCNGGEETASRQTKLDSHFHDCQQSDELRMTPDSSLRSENQLYESRPPLRVTAQSAGFNLNQKEMLPRISAGGEQIRNGDLLGSLLPGQFNQPDQIAPRSCPGDLRGAQQKMAIFGEKEDFYERASHNVQPAGLHSNQQRMYHGGITFGGGQVTGSHQGAHQRQRVAGRDGSQGLKPYIAVPMMSRPGEGEVVLEDDSNGHPRP